MNLTPEEQLLKQELDRFIECTGCVYYPDAALVENTIRILARRKIELGAPYCTCRLVTGKEEIDADIACPCKFAAEEIEKNGHCHCMLFAKKGFKP